VRHVDLPSFALVNRKLAAGLHPYLDVLPRAEDSPGVARIEPDAKKRQHLLQTARLRIHPGAGFAYVDVETPCIVFAEQYYRTGSDLDVYLDMLHELTHIRQHHEGKDLWDERYAYVDRPTEIEGYAVAVEEGRRLGMSDEDVVEHLTNPWMDKADVDRLVDHVQTLIAKWPKR
jgi:hypothetical protein